MRGLKPRLRRPTPGKLAQVIPLDAPPNLNPDRMRRIDYWVGIPICFVLTVISRVRSAFSGRSTPGTVAPRNALFIELAEMGSTVLACPAVHHLRRSHPDCRVFF